MESAVTILIVDDEPANVDMLSQELEEEGYALMTARDGAEALIKVQEQQPDLILLDVMMPNVDGFTVCRILKGSGKTVLIPVIMLTALRSHQDRVRGIEAGATISFPNHLTEMNCWPRSAPYCARRNTATSRKTSSKISFRAP